MAILSSLARSTINYSKGHEILKLNYNQLFRNAIRNMADEHHHFQIQPTRYSWRKFKDTLHFYAFLGIIPVSAIIFYCNVFIGPAELSEIPKDYVPKHWEYHRHPISRFIAKYLNTNPQQEYEKRLHSVYDQNEIATIRKVEKQVRELMSARNDYKSYYYRPAIGKYHRISKETADDLEALRGD